MNKISILLATTAIAVSSFSCQNGKVALTTNKDSISYAVGVSQGVRMNRAIEGSGQQGNTQIDKDKFLKGFNEGLADTTKFSYAAGLLTGCNMKKGIVIADSINEKIFLSAFESAVKGSKLQISDSLAQVVVRNYAQMRQKNEMEKRFGKNKQLGQDYITKFKKEHPDAVTTPSGLVYVVKKQGTGISPSSQDTVSVKYEGRLVSGKVFDKSNRDGKDNAVSFPVNGVIKGWTEMLQLMKPGEEVTVVIPQELAYGESGTYGIEPFSTLVFDVTLAKVKKADPTKPIEIK